MKKVYITLLSALFAGSAFAQTLSNDRMVIFDAAGNTYPFAVDRIQQITFPTVDGEASAAITVKGIDRDSVTFVVTRNDFCMNFKLDILPTTTADMLSDAAAAAYVDKNNKTVYSMDFTNGKVSLASCYHRRSRPIWHTLWRKSCQLPNTACSVGRRPQG